jgi:uncharacterized protein (DUF1499 family)
MRWKRVIWVVLAALSLGFAVIALEVDDWGRDFSTNHAETTDDAAHPMQRPLRITSTLADAVALVRATVAELPRWEAGPESLATDHALLRFVRTTPVLRFKDDVDVEIFANGPTCSISASSKSRIGKGDLGQNPRNLKELMAALRKRAAK